MRQNTICVYVSINAYVTTKNINPIYAIFTNKRKITIYTSINRDKWEKHGCPGACALGVSGRYFSENSIHVNWHCKLSSTLETGLSEN